MQRSISKVIIFPTLTDKATGSKAILALKRDNEISPLSGTISEYDVNCIYTAVRALLKDFLELEFKDTLDAIAQHGSNYWLDDTFRHWLIKFVDADFYDNLDDKTYTFIVPVDKELGDLQNDHVVRLSEEELEKSCPKESIDYITTKKYYEEAEKNGTIQYYGIINCEIKTSWRNHYEALYSGILKQKGERWLNFAASEYQLPTDEELTKLKGLVISGAGHAAYDNSPFHEQLATVLQKAYKDHPQLKILGICFGCQFLAHCLGGRAEKMPGLPVPFMTDLSWVQLTKDMKEKSYYKKTLEQFNLPEVDKFVAVESHGDHVAKLPEDAQILGHSETTNVEMWGLGEKILSAQFHPEFNEPLMKLKVLQELPYEEPVKQQMMDRFVESEKNHELHRSFQVNLCKNFLKS